MKTNDLNDLLKSIQSDPKEMALLKEDPVKYSAQIKPNEKTMDFYDDSDYREIGFNHFCCAWKYYHI